MILQLQPRIRVVTPLGAGLALFYEDDGEEIYWTVIDTTTRAIVQFRNDKIKAAACYTDGTGADDEAMRKIISKGA